VGDAADADGAAMMAEAVDLVVSEAALPVAAEQAETIEGPENVRVVAAKKATQIRSGDKVQPNRSARDSIEI
jgi:hypothetical protein